MFSITHRVATLVVDIKGEGGLLPTLIYEKYFLILVVCCQLPFFLGEGMWTLIVIKLLTFCICVFLLPPFVNNNDEAVNVIEKQLDGISRKMCREHIEKKLKYIVLGIQQKAYGPPVIPE